MKSYATADEAYTDLAVRMAHVARRHIFNRDWAQDAVHDAFTKAIEYVNKNKDRRVSGFLLMRELMRACRRINKRGSIEVPTDFSARPDLGD